MNVPKSILLFSLLLLHVQLSCAQVSVEKSTKVTATSRNDTSPTNNSDSPLRDDVADADTEIAETADMNEISRDPILMSRGRGYVSKYPVCSVYPGGVIEMFSSAAVKYDLMCTHVLATDYHHHPTKAWYVYGTFDRLDGHISLLSLTILTTSTGFELQRGWVVSNNGAPFPLREGVERRLGQCEVSFTGVHLKARCPEFEVWYDGIMTGHIMLKERDDEGEEMEEVPEKGEFQLGLCWDSDSEYGPNWQIGEQCSPDSDTDCPADCSVRVDLAACQQEHDTCVQYHVTDDVTDHLTGWKRYREGVLGACREVWCEEEEEECNDVTCQGRRVTGLQRCAMDRGDQVNLALRGGYDNANTPQADTCPEVECDWMRTVYIRGGSDELPPFEC